MCRVEPVDQCSEAIIGPRSEVEGSDESGSDDSSVSSIADSEVDGDAACLNHTRDSRSVLHKHRTPEQACKVLFQYFEECSPYDRLPLTDKIEQLSHGKNGFAGLVSLASDEIHPASWYAVAWYPIYEVPCTTVPGSQAARQLSASFVTFHSLSLGAEHGVEQNQSGFSAQRPRPPPTTARTDALVERRVREARPSLEGSLIAVLLPFAFAPYRMGGRIWWEADTSIRDCMLMAARVWVQRWQVKHHDWEFFSKKLALGLQESEQPARAS